MGQINYKIKLITAIIVSWFFIQIIPVTKAVNNSPFSSQGSLRVENHLTILYTASLKSTLNGCSCKSLPRAGVAKMAYFIRSYRKLHQDSILVDAGDFFDNWRTPELLAQYLLKIYAHLKYDVVGMGENEFSGGLDQIPEYQKTVPLRADNVLLKLGDREIPVSGSPIILKKGGMRVGILTTIDPASDLFAYYPNDIKERVIIAPVEETARQNLDILRQHHVNLSIWLFHGTLSNARTLAGKIQGIDVMIVAHEGEVTSEKAGDTLIVSPGDLGNRVGVLDISFSKGRVADQKNRFQEFNYQKDPDDLETSQMVTKYIQELNEKLKKE